MILKCDKQRFFFIAILVCVMQLGFTTFAYAKNLSVQSNRLKTDSLEGKWRLFQIETHSGVEVEKLRMVMKHTKGKNIAKGISANGSTVFFKRGDNNSLKLHFQTDKGIYQANLKHHLGRFEMKQSEWTGELYFNASRLVDDKTKRPTLIVLSRENNWPHDKPFIGEYSDEQSTALAKEDKNNTAPDGSLAGNWVLQTSVSDDQLLRVQIAHIKGEQTGIGGIALDAKSLGKDIYQPLTATVINNKQLNIGFKTQKGKYIAKLYKATNDPAYAQTWKGDLKLGNNHISSVSFYKFKSYSSKIFHAPFVFPSNLYDINKNKDDLVFFCKKSECTYDDKSTGLKGIPLINNWAIEALYYYKTPNGSFRSKVPTINFVNIKNGLWINLNQPHAMKDPQSIFCYEFGKNGRLSSEESICLVKELSDEASQIEASIYMEEIETWRDKSYSP